MNLSFSFIFSTAFPLATPTTGSFLASYYYIGSKDNLHQVSALILNRATLTCHSACLTTDDFSSMSFVTFHSEPNGSADRFAANECPGSQLLCILNAL